MSEISACNECESIVSGKKWYALMTKPRHEKVACAGLVGKGYEVMLPTYRTWYRSGGGLRSSDLPLFGGYLFSYFEAQQRLPLLVTPGVLGVLSNGRVPLPLDDREVEAIRQVCVSELPLQPWPYLQTGDRVRIEVGALRGVEGIYARDEKADRLIISITLLRRSVSVKMPREWIRPVHMVPVRLPAA